MAKQGKKTDNRIKKANGSKEPNKTLNPHTKDGRARRMIRFHLDISRDDDYELTKQFDGWKETREFLPMLRKAFWLLISLMSGSIELLMEYFPGIVESIQRDARAKLEADNARLTAQNEALQNITQQQEVRIAELEQQVSSKQPSASDEFLALVRSAVRDEMRQREPVLVEAAPALVLPQAVGLKASQSTSVGNSSAVGLKGIQGQHVTMSIPLPDDDDDSDEALFEVKQHIGDGSANRRFIQALLDLQKSPDKDE